TRDTANGRIAKRTVAPAAVHTGQAVRHQKLRLNTGAHSKDTVVKRNAGVVQIATRLDRGGVRIVPLGHLNLMRVRRRRDHVHKVVLNSASHTGKNRRSNLFREAFNVERQLLISDRDIAVDARGELKRNTPLEKLTLLTAITAAKLTLISVEIRRQPHGNRVVRCAPEVAAIIAPHQISHNGFALKQTERGADDLLRLNEFTHSILQIECTTPGTSVTSGEP